MENLIYSAKPEITIATNTFIDVPVVLQIDDVNIIEMVQDVDLGYTTLMSIFSADGFEIAKIKGTRIYPTEAGKEYGLVIDKNHDTWVGKMGNTTIFENKVQNGEAFKMQAELYSPSGYLFKSTDYDGLLLNQEGIQIANVLFKGNTISGARVGISMYTK